MKKRMALLAAVLLLACLAAHGGAEASEEEMIQRYLGGWLNDDYRMYIRLEGDEVYSRLYRPDDSYVWEFDRCYYDEEDGCLYGPNYVRYREVIDPDTLELLQEDWALGDLGFTSFAFDGDGDTLVVSDIPDLDEPLTFRRVSDEEYSGH